MAENFKLFEAITRESNSDSWLDAKKEWFPFDFYCDDTGNIGCCCGKFPIRNICVIKHVDQPKTMVVGNFCITRFMDIPISNKIFTSASKLKKDLTKSLNIDVVHYLREINIINDYEYQFYLDRKSKRKLSVKQKAFKIKINQKFLAWISENEKPHQLRCGFLYFYIIQYC
ncbi:MULTISPECIES: hypothetical protein [Empedobacter]|uniref:hypothetical protein n=1 Tax=Empedobacter TaxID=59734 RepID=UPI0025772E44|nr:MULTISPECIES: hypothetical protein [Empedobacter]MDM1041691.1 hypothetical protein [Empedobacter brevis]MDM1135175.1 hypothetical protein [Empedobacter sp. R750]